MTTTHTTTLPTTVGESVTIPLVEHSMAPWQDIESSLRARLFGHLVGLYMSAVDGVDEIHFRSDLFHDAICVQGYDRDRLARGFAFGADEWGTQILSAEVPTRRTTGLTLDECVDIVRKYRRHAWTLVVTVDFDKDAMVHGAQVTITKVGQR